jgi:hypothetical protein
MVKLWSSNRGRIPQLGEGLVIDDVEGEIIFACTCSRGESNQSCPCMPRWIC